MVAKLSWTIVKRASSTVSAVAIACGSLSNATRRPFGAQARQQQAAVAAAAEGAVDVDAVGARAGRWQARSTASSSSTVRC
jgi:hypothetical protein